MLALRYGRPAAMGAACTALVVALGAPARCEEGAAWLAWSAPPECQNSSEVERRLELLLGRPVDFARVPATRVEMAWTIETGWAVRVTVELADGPRTRSLEAPSCAEAFDVVALSLALILDPALEAAGASHASASAGATSELESALADAPPEERPEPVRLAPAPAAQAPRAATEAVAAPPPRARLSLAGTALTDLSTFPVPQFGAGALAALRIGAFRAEIEGDLLASESASFPNAEERASFTTWLGVARACHALMLGSRFAWVGCAGIQAGSLATHELGGDERRERGVWAAAELVTGPEFSATPWLRAFARVRGVTPLIRHEFYLSGGSRAHELPWFGLQLQLGISADVTELGGG